MAISKNDTPKEAAANSSSSNLLANDPSNNSNSTESVASHDGGEGAGGMPAWAILLIVAVCIMLLISLGIGGYIAAKRIRDRRKNHGEYKPQQVEHMHARDLPYITPPNIEALPAKY